MIFTTGWKWKPVEQIYTYCQVSGCCRRRHKGARKVVYTRDPTLYPTSLFPIIKINENVNIYVINIFIGIGKAILLNHYLYKKKSHYLIASGRTEWVNFNFQHNHFFFYFSFLYELEREKCSCSTSFWVLPSWIIGHVSCLDLPLLQFTLCIWKDLTTNALEVLLFVITQAKVGCPQLKYHPGWNFPWSHPLLQLR